MAMSGGDLSAVLVDLSGLHFGKALLSALGMPDKTRVQCFVGDRPETWNTGFQYLRVDAYVSMLSRGSLMPKRACKILGGADFVGIGLVLTG
jgi:hypothetical protein